MGFCVNLARNYNRRKRGEYGRVRGRRWRGSAGYEGDGRYARECVFMSHTRMLRACEGFQATLRATDMPDMRVSMERKAMCMAVCEGPVIVHIVCIVVGR